MSEATDYNYFPAYLEKAAELVGKDYRNYDGIKAKVDNGGILARAVLNRDMPPEYSEGPKGLAYCDSREIQEWIKAGAPNN